MESTAKKLWNRDFSLLVIGQLISIFGNQVLNFALPLYILEMSGSPALFGTVLGLSFLPLVITSPMGGIMADRLKKQRIMFWLDASITAMIVLYMIMSGLFAAAIVPIVIVKLLALNAIQGMYMPAVQSSIPFLVPKDKLVQANSATSVVNTLSNIAAPAAAGFFLGRFGLFPILIICAICFAITAIMDLMIRIPYKKQQAAETVAQIVKHDMTQAFRFVKENPILTNIAIMMFVIAALSIGILMTGVPVFITQHLEMSMEHMGLGRAISWGGALLGTAIASFLGERLTIHKVPLFAMLLGLSMMPIGIVLLLDIHYFAAFIVMIASDFIFTVFVLLYMIAMMTYIQKITPEELVGKVMSLFSGLPFVAGGLGYLIFGILFEQFYSLSWLIVFVTAFICCITVLLFRKHFAGKNINERSAGYKYSGQH